MLNWFQIPLIEGNTSRQAHTDLPEGTYERELGREGFYGPATQMYHRHPPTNWQLIDGPLKPRAFDAAKEALSRNLYHSPWPSKILLSNTDVQIRLWYLNSNMQKLARNADGDQLLFVHKGSGELFCDYGHMSFTEGDYLLLPRGTLWRLETDSVCAILMIEACNDSYAYPDKGIVGQHAVFDQAIMETPHINERFKRQYAEQTWEVEIKRLNQITTMQYGYNPLDAVGWHGNLTVLKLNWRDIRPLMSHRYHIPPSGHTTFAAQKFVVCTFCPRPFESDPGALRVPFYHSNEDYDEVIFYHRGDFFSRDNIHPGMLTLHPCGFPHGPHPKAFLAGQKRANKITDEVAVMIDTREPLKVSATAETIEWADYWESWK